ncbi:MAG: hypothetical protein PHS45_02555 [Bacilli bacterium]|nr:hypothetical protein [Bacilli bacterium]
MNKKIIVILVVLIIVILIFMGIYPSFLKMGKNKEKEIKTFKVVKEIEGYDYKLKDNDPVIYKDIFNDLEMVLKAKPINEEEYAKCIAKLFIIDFYTLDNKTTKNEVGGVEFVHLSEVDDFIKKAQDTVYKYIENNIYGDRKQELPIVKIISTKEVTKISYKYLNNTDNEAYQIKLAWEYVKDLDYQTEATVILVHENNKISVLEMK